ncbi:transcription elongation factor GreA [Candidatus Gottesmanbacteria bacterium]|nr:transcription elongation factor GreA [Candidatus Gottesmanbacteria bacterium]
MTDVNQKILLTAQGLEELKKEYHSLVEKKRPELVDRLAQARELGDLSENSEYAAAKEDLAFVDGRIVELENVLKDVKVVNVSKKKTAVGLGCKVHVKLNGKEVVFTIVGEWESNPNEKKISHTSPLGKALIGKKAGDIAIVEAPAGRVNYKILKIE